MQALGKQEKVDKYVQQVPAESVLLSVLPGFARRMVASEVVRRGERLL